MNETQENIDKRFLFQQNRKLRLQVKESKQILATHKTAISELAQNKPSQNNIISALVSIIVRQTPKSQEITRLSLELNKLSHEKILLQKIIADIESEQQENYHILMEDFDKLKQNNQELEKQLHKFYEKIGEVDYLSGLVVKNKSLINPSEQALVFKKQQEELLEFIGMQKSTIDRLVQEKSKLLKINIHMKDQVEKKKEDIKNMTVILTNPDAMSMLNNSVNANQGEYEPCENILAQLQQQNNEPAPKNQTQTKKSNGADVPELRVNNNNLSMLNFTNLNTSLLNTTQSRNLNSTLNFIRMQHMVIKQKDEDELESSFDVDSEQMDCQQLNILFPDKVQQIRKERETAKVPYLNMMKIRQIMAKKQSKIRKDVEAERHNNPTQKIIKLQSQLEITRRQLTNQSLKFRIMEQKIKKYEKQLDQLEHRNNFLCMANQRYMKGYRHLYRENIWCRRLWGMIQKVLNLNIEGIFSNKVQQNGQNAQSILKPIIQQIKDPSQYIRELEEQTQKDENILKKIEQKLDNVFYKHESPTNWSSGKHELHGRAQSAHR